MGRYATETRLDMESAREKTIEYFGTGGLGLKLVEERPCCVRFEGGGGYVTVGFPIKHGHKLDVEIVTREWDRHIGAFMQQIS